MEQYCRCKFVHGAILLPTRRRPTAALNDAVEALVESARTLTRDGEGSDGMIQTFRCTFKDAGLPF